MTNEGEVIGFSRGPKPSPAYVTRITSMLILPAGDDFNTPRGTTISVDDEGAGAFVRIRQCPDGAIKAHEIAINPEEWPAVRGAIEAMVAVCGEFPDPSEPGARP
jgi:hypothetical protein